MSVTTRSWRQTADPRERAEQDAARYAEAVVAALGAEWRTVAVVRTAGGVGIRRVRKILARSSADALLGLVLTRLVKLGFVVIEDEIVRFTPAMIKRFRRGD